MAFDLKTAALPPQHNDGVFMPFKDQNGAPFKDDASGTEVGVTLRSRLSRAAMAANRDAAAKRVARQRANRDLSVEDIEDEQTDLLAACTVGWTFTEMDGSPFPFSMENARFLWGNEDFIQHRAAALAFINGEANFTKR